jgi:hypothetical protein
LIFNIKSYFHELKGKEEGRVERKEGRGKRRERTQEREEGDGREGIE